MGVLRSRLARGLIVAQSLVTLPALGLIAYGGLVWTRQGLDAEELSEGAGVQVEVDEHGIPTLSGASWEELARAQGYVVAANRLWQMDLMRRAAGGGLSAWFGAKAVEADGRRLAEDWPGVAERLAEALPAEQRAFCERYAEGVNAFIAEAPGRWGVEYAILRAEPEPWACADSMLIMLSMAEDLSMTSDEDLARWGWRAALPEPWERFLFTEDHPWNQPLFGEAAPPPTLPEQGLAGASSPAVSPPADDPVTEGSNSWAWRGSTGAFLVNDPHLGANVPHLWFLLRLRVSAQEWVVGSAIPGIPGVVLGMNPHLAWSFTNTGEDVDDLVVEQLSADGTRYLSHLEPGPDGVAQPVWREVETRTSTVAVKDGAPVEVVGRFTERGPLSRVEGPEGPVWVSRLWLPFQDPRAVAGLPGFDFARARDLDEMERAIDGFRFPAQNVLAMDRAGTVLYRSSGLGVRRVADGATPGPALTHAWAGLATVEERPRLRVPAEAPGPVHVETANARIWAGPWHQGWASDRRTARIRALLSGRDDLTQADMERFQLDTTSRYHQLLVGWVAARATAEDPQTRATLARWAAWDGDAASDPRIFTEALAVQAALRDGLLLPVRRALLPPAMQEAPWSWGREDAWILTTLGLGDPGLWAGGPVDWEAARAREGLDRFGLEAGQLCEAAIRAAAGVSELYTVTNRWAAQHPFVGRVPVLGPRFAVDTPEQLGWSDLVRVERPKSGASVRFVWNLREPARSTWITPVGQSGHVRSEHYEDLQARFHSNQRLMVFPENYDWGF